MTLPFHKTNFLATVERLEQAVRETLPRSPHLRAFAELREDLEQDYYIVVVVGEFKHGKSTFVNALLGQDVMPADVTPTTATINAVFYGEEPQLHVVTKTGEREIHPLADGSLQPYTASSGFNGDDIQFLKVFLPAPLLKENVVLVDTPGVNDLNQHRADITYQFIPRADAVLFMLDMTSPLSKTEEEFLRHSIVAQGLNRVVYIANFLDRVEEEEVDAIIDRLERRLQAIHGSSVPVVLPISALEALEANRLQNDELLEVSGFSRVESTIRELLANGSRQQEKAERYRTRLQQLMNQVEDEALTAEQLSRGSEQELLAQVDATHAWFANQDKWQRQVQSYLNERQGEILFLVRKSVLHFGERLREDVQNRIHMFYGPSPKVLIENQLPIVIRTAVNQWLDQYSAPLHELLFKLEQEVSKGLSAAFQQSVQIRVYESETIRYEVVLPMLTAPATHSNVKAGLLLGGVSSLVLMLGGSVLLPIIGMAGLPFLQQKVAESQWENLKSEVLAVMNQHISAVVDDLAQHLEDYVIRAIDELGTKTQSRFAELIAYVSELAEEELKKKQGQAQIESHQQVAIRRLLEIIEMLRITEEEETV